MSDSLNTINILHEEWHILGDLNINLCENDILIRENHKILVKGTKKVSPEVKKYFEFRKAFGFKQIIQSPTRTILNTSSLIDHVLTNTNEKKAQCGLINVELSDHQMIFHTRKTKKEKVGVHKQISFRSFKKYSVDEYEKALDQVIFPNYEKYSNVNKAYT